jgi:large subunit ribosomal protein L10
LTHKISREKQDVVANLARDFNQFKTCILTNYLGLKVEELTTLRKEFIKNNLFFRVVKNTLAKKAIIDTPCKDLTQYFTGDTLLIASKNDQIIPCKILAKFIKQEPRLKIKAAVIGLKIVRSEEVIAIASLPSREELLAKLCYLLESPITGLINVINNPRLNLLYVLNAIKEKKPIA